ncbi:cobalt-precorrin-7 (C(5))-methyltransferase [Deinococcus aquiradiocola]|uniref:Cobalt-precorrin-7 (C(5))-methyltransferase n=1 Tax=Deinococcus aquiradiocola TaxID=393059 RepID=A0A917PAH1_9DEIO|nr:cobalt-precorrin-7 (C(5))-methyltransferase [Deinococcus aquiradiocola]GGJ68667.1 cobalt-precorrin-7 (C(5))-methyltransferase [Deinococcus aquiradiocola]
MITCIGIGPGSLDYLTSLGRHLITDAEVVAGFDTVLDLVAPLIRPDAVRIGMGYRDQTQRLAEVAALHHAGKRCVVAFMGDVHFSGFQFLERVELACGERVDTVPGISSAQILASRGRVCFDETTFLTFHRRGDVQPFKTHLIHALQDGRNAIVIPRPWDFMPRDVAAHCLQHGVAPDRQVEVWEALTQRDAAWAGRLDECTQAFSDLSIMLIRAPQAFPSQLDSPESGALPGGTA